MPNDGVERFSERSEERRQFFEETVARFPDTRISPLLWALFQIADLEKLRKFTLNELAWMNISLGVESEPSVCERYSLDTFRLWRQRSVAKDSTPASSKRSCSDPFRPPTHFSPLRSRPTIPTDLPRTRSGKSLEGSEHSPVRDRKIAQRCKERDSGLCVVSRIGGVEACHLYPRCAFGGRNPGQVKHFWTLLRMFWPEDKVNSWHAKIFKDERTSEPLGTETVENMLTFTSTLHRFHAKGAFALRPVRILEDKTQLELEFHWLAWQQRDSTTRVDLREQPLSSRGRTDSKRGIEFFRFEDATNPTPLFSGTRFVITTDDPTNKPLPDPGLLEMQWHLQRVLAMSGAAGWKEEDFHYDDPNAGANALPSVEQWLDNVPDEREQSPRSSPSDSSVVIEIGGHK